MQVVAVQFDIAWEDKVANHARIEARLDGAEIGRGSFVVLPELADTGFSFDLDHIVDDISRPWAEHVAGARGIWLQHGYPERGSDGKGRNCASIFSPDGVCVGTYRKVHPFTYSREGEHYGGGDRLVLRRCGEAIVCPVVCYDLRFPELWRLAARAGAEVFTVGANWPAARRHHWRTLLIARAIENQAYVVGANRVGSDPQHAYAGGSIIVSPTGEVVEEAGDESTLLRAELDLDALRCWRSEFPALDDLHEELLGSIEVDGP
ncbi:MAG: nitrilase-related carbon-nitrogen hydrolase [Planctomycetota bacterium]|jgi:predicted amidohydrolase